MGPGGGSPRDSGLPPEWRNTHHGGVPVAPTTDRPRVRIPATGRKSPPRSRMGTRAVVGLQCVSRHLLCSP